MNKLKRIIASTLVIVGFIGTPLVLSTPSFAAVNPQEQACLGTGGKWSGTKCTGNSSSADLPKIVKTIINVLLYIIGAVAVIMIIVGAFRFVTSGGNASGVKAGKDTILYAVIGLVVAILAYAIVNFVIRAFN